MAVVIIVAITLALVIGLLANRYVRPFATSELQGIKLETLVSPVMALTVLLLAFVLVQTFTSFQRGQGRRQRGGAEGGLHLRARRLPP